MVNYSQFVLLLTCLSFVNSEKKFIAKKLPDYMVPCSASAANLSECGIKHANEAIPYVLKGNPKFKLPPLVPFHLDKIELKPSDRLTLILKDLELYGFDNMVAIDSKMDLKNKHISFSLFSPSVKIIGNYNISGQILVLPITGEGPATFTFENGTYDYAYDYDLVKKSDGKEYVANIRPTVDFKIAKSHYQFDNLFNGNKELSDNMNKVLNDNSEEVLKDFGVAISEVIKVVATGLVHSFLTVVPYDEIYLP